MKPEEVQKVRTGDILSHASGGTYVVTDVANGVPIVARTCLVTVPEEWSLVARATGYEWSEELGGGPVDSEDL